MNDNFKNNSIALFFGGRSPEHEVSINSAKTIYPILKNLFKDVYLIYVEKQGNYLIVNIDDKLFINKNYTIKDKIISTNEISFIANKGLFLNSKKINIDLAFILIHGNEGEDGKLQGLLEIMNIKYTGVNSTSSGICMYKDLTNQILISNNIKTVPTLVLNKKTKIPNLEAVQNKFGKSLFIKSETTGSSIGITALNRPTQESLEKAIKYSFGFSERVLIQPLLEDIKEIEIAMLETNNDLIAAGPGLVVKTNMKDVLSYDKKYGDIDTATINPAAITDENLKSEIKKQAKVIFNSLNLSGFSRIDFFLYKNIIYLNEVNTIPGLTDKSHYPILVESENISLESAIYQICRTAYEK